MREDRVAVLAEGPHWARRSSMRGAWRCLGTRKTGWEGGEAA